MEVTVVRTQLLSTPDSTPMAAYVHQHAQYSRRSLIPAIVAADIYVDKRYRYDYSVTKVTSLLIHWLLSHLEVIVTHAIHCIFAIFMDTVNEAAASMIFILEDVS